MNIAKLTQTAALALSLLMMAGSVLAAPAGYRLHVDGLACPFCAYGIEKQLSAVDGVARVETDIKQGVVVIMMKEGAAIDEAAARQAVKKAGFTLEELETLAPEN